MNFNSDLFLGKNAHGEVLYAICYLSPKYGAKTLYVHASSAGDVYVKLIRKNNVLPKDATVLAIGPAIGVMKTAEKSIRSFGGLEPN